VNYVDVLQVLQDDLVDVSSHFFGVIESHDFEYARYHGGRREPGLRQAVDELAAEGPE